MNEKTIQDDFSIIDVKATNAAIIVERANIEQAFVRLENEQKKNYKFQADVQKGTLKVQLEEKGLRLFSLNVSQAPKIIVQVPDNQYSKIVVKTDNGKIDVHDLSSEHVELKTANGKISLESFDAETIVAKSSNGQISFNDVKGELEASTNTGKIILRTADLDRNITFTTDVGKIIIETKKEPTNATITAKTSVGSVEIFGAKNRELTYGKGKYSIDLSTEVGKIEIIQ